MAAVSISGIVQRFSAERLPGLIRSVMKLGDQPHPSRLGYRACPTGGLGAHQPRGLFQQIPDLAEEADRPPSSIRWSVVSDNASMRRLTTWSCWKTWAWARWLPLRVWRTGEAR